jgi:hypothetical protein
MLRAAWHRLFHFQQAETPLRDEIWGENGFHMDLLMGKKEWVDVI